MSAPAQDRDAPIVIGARPSAGRTRWGLLLVVFMRIIAVLWIIEGLIQWRLVLLAPNSLFDVAPRSVSVAVVAFAVIDILAGVGLWLASPWGGVVWLAAALMQIGVAYFIPTFFAGGALLIVLNVALIALYLFLTWQAGREPDRRSHARAQAARWWRRQWRATGR